MPLFQSESEFETFHMKMTLICMKMGTACRTHVHMKGFRIETRFETEVQENSEMA